MGVFCTNLGDYTRPYSKACLDFYWQRALNAFPRLMCVGSSKYYYRARKNGGHRKLPVWADTKVHTRPDDYSLQAQKLTMCFSLSSFREPEIEENKPTAIRSVAFKILAQHFTRITLLSCANRKIFQFFGVLLKKFEIRSNWEHTFTFKAKYILRIFLAYTWIYL